MKAICKELPSFAYLERTYAVRLTIETQEVKNNKLTQDVQRNTEGD